MLWLLFLFFFFFNDTATTEIYTLSLHDALPISGLSPSGVVLWVRACRDAGSAAGRLSRLLRAAGVGRRHAADPARSEEHTSELQSRQYLVCRLLLEKKKTNKENTTLRITQSLLL